MDPSLRRMMSRQRGHVSSAQAKSVGLTARQMDLRVERGEWVRVHRAVFRDASHPETWHAKLWAAVLAGGEGTMVSARACVGVRGLFGYKPFVVEISVARLDAPRIKGAIVHSAPDLLATECARRDGIPVTSPARTLLDL